MSFNIIYRVLQRDKITKCCLPHLHVQERLHISLMLMIPLRVYMLCRKCSECFTSIGLNKLNEITSNDCFFLPKQIILEMNNQQNETILIDQGKTNWRKNFRSTKLHDRICINNFLFKEKELIFYNNIFDHRTF